MTGHPTESPPQADPRSTLAGHPGPEQAPESARGRTAGDTFLELLGNLGHFWIGLLVLPVAFALIVLGFIVGLKLTGGGLQKAGPFEFNFANPGSVSLFRQRNDETIATLLVVAANQDWQSTEIAVREGDTIEFQATGSVQISLSDFISTTQLRTTIDSTIANEHGLPQGLKTPEDYFDPAQDSLIRLPRPWVGPEGDVRGSSMDHRFPGRTRRKVIPDAPYGALVAAVVPAGDSAAGSGPFLVGQKTTVVAPHAGTLWLNINDVRWTDGRFYNDNLGYFLVTVIVPNN
jgi:hypothetical protein